MIEKCGFVQKVGQRCMRKFGTFTDDVVCVCRTHRTLLKIFCSVQLLLVYICSKRGSEGSIAVWPFRNWRKPHDYFQFPNFSLSALNNWHSTIVTTTLAWIAVHSTKVASTSATEGKNPFLCAPISTIISSHICYLKCITTLFANKQ